MASRSRTRINYVGLFALVIDDKTKTVVLTGPNRTGSTSDQMTDSEVEKNKKWALHRADKFKLLGYSVIV